MRESVKIVNGALDEFGPRRDIVLRGVLSPDSLRLLQVGPYQREILPLATLKELVEAFEHGGKVPDIELGMRGVSCRDNGGTFYLQDEVYIVDGLQRVTAAGELLKKGKTPHLGATIHFNTTEPWERERFKVLNADRTKLASNVLYRNAKETSTAVRKLYNLTYDSSFALGAKGGRVCWDQRMRREHLLNATTYLKVAAVLHARFGPGRQHGVDELIRGLQKIGDSIGLMVMAENVRTFFEIIDECWGVRSVAFKEGAKYLRGTFLHVLANFFTRHRDFWRGSTLVVDKDLRRKIAQFPVATDPNVGNLASSGGNARHILYQMLVDHVNSGKRSKRLVEDFVVRHGADLDDESDEPVAASA